MPETNVAETTYVRLKEHVPVEIKDGKFSKAPQVLEIGNGEYRRTFRAAEQPFAVVNKEELLLLLNTGFFEQVSAPVPETLVETKQEAEMQPSEHAKRPKRKENAERAEGVD